MLKTEITLEYLIQIQMFIPHTLLNMIKLTNHKE